MLQAKGVVNSLTIGGDFSFTPLHWAVAAGQTQAVKILMAFGADEEIKGNFGIDSINCI